MYHLGGLSGRQTPLLKPSVFFQLPLRQRLSPPREAEEGRLLCDLGRINSWRPLNGAKEKQRPPLRAETLGSKDTSVSAGKEAISSFWNKVESGGFDLLWGAEMVKGTTDCGKQAGPMGGRRRGRGGSSCSAPGATTRWSQDAGSWTPTFL